MKIYLVLASWWIKMPKGRTAKENSQAGVTSFIDFKEMPKLALAKKCQTDVI